MSRTSNKGYQFTISGSTVTAVYEIENGRSELERMERDETWTFDGSRVIKTELDDGRLETTVYTDSDGDGLFVKAGKVYGDSSPAGTMGSNQGSHSTTGRPQAEKGYRFSLDADGEVTGVQKVENGRTRAEKIDRNETWTFDGQDLVQTETRRDKVEIELYRDTDQDGLFQSVLELEVLTTGNARTLETHRFTLDDGTLATGENAMSGDLITGAAELGRRGWKAEKLEAGETLEIVDTGTDRLILKSQAQRNGEIDFSIFRDDDGDGLWSEIAEGEARDAFVSAEGRIDLVGLLEAGLLQPADLLVA